MKNNPHTAAQDDRNDLVDQLVNQLKDGSGEKFPESSAAAGLGGEAPFPPSSDKSGTPTGE